MIPKLTTRFRLGIPTLLTIALTLGLGHAQDLGSAAGYLSGSIESEAVSPPNLAWEVLEGEGPNDGDCIGSGLLWNALDPSIAQLTLTGPGLLSFKWLVSSTENDGWLSCQINQVGGRINVARISGDDGEWHSMQVFIPQGEHTVSWIYRKQTAEFGGDDLGKLADLSFAPYTATPQSFEEYKAAHSVTGEGRTVVGGRRLDTSWLMGLAPNEATPEGLMLPVNDGESTRYRMRFSLRADGFIAPQSSPDLSQWNDLELRAEIVEGSLNEDSVDMEFTVPSGQQLFFRSVHQSIVTPPTADYAYIPSGTYLASSPPSELGRDYGISTHNYEENYLHDVTLTRGFFLKRHETTWVEWVEVQAWGQANGYTFGDGDEARGGRLLLQEEGGNILDAAPADDDDQTHPVSNVGIHDALKWLNAKSQMEGLEPCYFIRLKPANGGQTVPYRDQSIYDTPSVIEDILCDWDSNGYRLPTEAEWEYACRAGTLTSLSNGLNLTTGAHYGNFPDPSAGPIEPNLDAIASHWGNGAATRPVGSFEANPFGLYDMHGNVTEWCWDTYNSIKVLQQFTGEPLTDPKGPDEFGFYHITRGGSWRMPGHLHRSACRTWSPPGGGNSHESGFRYALNAPE